MGETRCDVAAHDGPRRRAPGAGGDDQPRRGWRTVLPSAVAGCALALAVLGGILTARGDGIGALNLFVESLSGSSGRLLGDGWALLPLGFAFGAGMVSAVNPCGFVMLPAYLAMYAGTPDATRVGASPQLRLLQALLVGGTVTTAFVVLFGIVGVTISAGAQSLVAVFPWIGLAVGVLLVLAGAWLGAGGKLYIGLAARAAGRVGGQNQVGLRSYFLFGLSYGVASLSCTLPIFLAVVGSSLAVGGLVTGIGQFILYAIGMGLVVLVLTLAVALLKGAMVGTVRKAMPYVQTISAGLMVLAGAYVVFYWLTVGGLLSSSPS